MLAIRNWTMRVRASLLGLLLAAIVGLSFAPIRWKVRLRTNGSHHFQGHVLAFALVGYVLSNLTSKALSRSLALLLGFGLAFAIEWGEALRYGFSLEWRDIYADALGLGFGATLFLLIQGLRQR